jgi:drug/metabolite transporter (DMT)-like permease
MSTALEKKRAYLAWFMLCFVWGTTYLAIKIALETIPPFLIGGLRYLAAGTLLFAVLRLRGYAMPSRAEWKASLIAGVLLLGIGNGGVIWAELWVPTGFAAILVACVPFWMVGTEAVLPKGDPLTRRSLLGLLIGFAGIVLLVWPNLRLDGHDGWTFALGVIVLQIACVGWALGSSLSRRRASKGDPVMFAATQMVCGGVVMFLAGLVSGDLGRLVFSTRSASALLYLIVAGSLIGYVAYIYALTHLPATMVSTYTYANPVVAVTLGTLVLGEPFSWRIVFAVGIVLSGMFIVSRKPAAPASAPIEKSADQIEQGTAVSRPSPRSSTA